MRFRPGRTLRPRGDRLRRLRTSFRHEIQFCAEVFRRRLGLTSRRFLAESQRPITRAHSERSEVKLKNPVAKPMSNPQGSLDFAWDDVVIMLMPALPRV